MVHTKCIHSPSSAVALPSLVVSAWNSWTQAAFSWARTFALLAADPGNVRPTRILLTNIIQETEICKEGGYRTWDTRPHWTDIFIMIHNNNNNPHGWLNTRTRILFDYYYYYYYGYNRLRTTIPQPQKDQCTDNWIPLSTPNSKNLWPW